MKNGPGDVDASSGPNHIGTMEIPNAAKRIVTRARLGSMFDVWYLDERLVLASGSQRSFT